MPAISSIDAKLVNRDYVTRPVAHAFARERRTAFSLAAALGRNSALPRFLQPLLRASGNEFWGCPVTDRVCTSVAGRVRSKVIAVVSSGVQRRRALRRLEWSRRVRCVRRGPNPRLSCGYRAWDDSTG